MHSAERRLTRLEARMLGVWPAEVHAAKERALARLRLKISVALDSVGDPTFTADVVRLADDTPEQAAADTAMLQRWARQYPATLYPVDHGVRARIAAKLDAMAHRLEARRREPDA